MTKNKIFKLINSKKGMDIDLWFNVFEFIMIFLVAIVLYETINSEVENISYYQNYLARDTALLLNTIYASPGNIEYHYPLRENNFIFDFKENKIEIYEPHEFVEGGVVSYPFAEDKTYTLSYAKLLPKDSENVPITYKKEKDIIIISR